MILIEHLTKMQVNGNFVSGEKVKEQIFGGFCTCGGVMFQKLWFNVDGKLILVSECEKCWRNEAMVFNRNELVSRDEVRVVDRRNFSDVILEILTEKEYNAIQAKINNKEYSPSTLSNAKKKLSNVGLSIEEITSYI